MRNDIEQALRDYEIKTFGNAKNIEKMEEVLTSDEKVIYISPTNAIKTNHLSKKKEKLPGVFAITSKRIVFRYSVLASIKTDSISLSDVESIGCTGNGLTGGHVTVSTGTKDFDFLVNYKKSVFQNVQHIIQQTVNDFRSNPPGTSNASSNEDILSQIQKLADLKDKNIISDEEFQTKKSELLSRL